MLDSEMDRIREGKTHGTDADLFSMITAPIGIIVTVSIARVMFADTANPTAPMLTIAAMTMATAIGMIAIGMTVIGTTTATNAFDAAVEGGGVIVQARVSTIIYLERIRSRLLAHNLRRKAKQSRTVF